MKEQLINKLVLLKEIFAHTVLSIPVQKERGQYVIQYYRSVPDRDDMLDSTLRWRVTDQNSQIAFATSTVTGMLTVLEKLGVDAEDIAPAVDHQLVIMVGWHAECMKRTTNTMGEDYPEIAKKKQDEIITELNNTLVDMMEGKDVKDKLNDLIFHGKMEPKPPKLTIVTEEE